MAKAFGSQLQPFIGSMLDHGEDFLKILDFWIQLGVASLACAWLYYRTRAFFKIDLHFID